MKYQENVEFTLLGNGLDFIWSALEHLSGNPGKRELKYAVLHLCSGIELVLKERLQREHWSLIFEKLDSANQKDYEAGKLMRLVLLAWQRMNARCYAAQRSLVFRRKD